ncbi:hypothetical protein OIU76_020663 [Salix suchowensis]|nr:hypothetical protein OIU76_020663 [Salix suchowensis]
MVFKDEALVNFHDFCFIFRSQNVFSADGQEGYRINGKSFSLNSVDAQDGQVTVNQFEATAAHGPLYHLCRRRRGVRMLPMEC